MPDGGEEVAAVAEQDPDALEDDCDVLGHGSAGLILWRIGRRGWIGYVGFHCQLLYITRDRETRFIFDL